MALAGLAVVLAAPALSGDLLWVVVSATGVLCCALYTIAARRWIGGSDSTFAVVLGQQAWALLFALGLVAVTALGGGAVTPRAVTLSTVASAVSSGLLYYAVAYWLYLSALRVMPASVAATSFYLIPVFGLAAAAVFGERLAGWQWVGAAVVIAAVATIGWFQRRTASTVAAS